MRKETSFEILKQNLADLEEANKWLIHFYQIYERWRDRSDLEVPEYDAIKSFFSLYTYLWSATMKDISFYWRFWVGTIGDHAGCAKSCWKERTDRLIRASKRVDGTAKSNFPWLHSPLDVLPLGDSATGHAGQINAELAKLGMPIGPYDQLIAGYARSMGLVLVTNNEKKFSRVSGLNLRIRVLTRACHVVFISSLWQHIGSERHCECSEAILFGR